MKTKKNHTKAFLIFFSIANFLGIIGNIYFSRNPPGFNLPEFNPLSLAGGAIIISKLIVMVMIYFVALNVKSLYAKVFWFILFALFISHAFLWKAFIDPPRFIPVLECTIAFVVSTIFMFLYQKHKFDIFEATSSQNE